jgi:hypothetical protein
MMYRYRTCTPKFRERAVAERAAEAAAHLLKLDFIPDVRFFVLDPHGPIEKEALIVGFFHGVPPDHFDTIYARADRSPAQTAHTVFHEARHLKQFNTDRWKQMNREQREAEAEEFARLAPTGESFERVYGELTFKLAKASIRSGELTNARVFASQLSLYNQPAAMKLASEIYSASRA